VPTSCFFPTAYLLSHFSLEKEMEEDKAEEVKVKVEPFVHLP
jgi:hypothetical protein